MLAELLGLRRGAGSSGSGRRGPALRTLENPAISLQDPDAWNEAFGDGVRTDAGILVGHDTALRSAPLWQAVSMISGDVAKLPLDLYKQNADGTRTADRKHPAFWLVRRRANRERPAFGFWRTLMVHALLYGNGYAYIDRNGRGDPIELLNLLPDRTAPGRRGGALYYVTETQFPNGGAWLREMPARDVLHVRGLQAGSCAGDDLVAAARNAIAVGLAAEGFAAKFFKHGVRSAGILELPVGMPRPAQNTVEEGFRKYSEGPENWFKTVILRDGAKFHSISVDPAAAEMTGTREQVALDVARFFNLAPSRLGIKGSVSYNSQAEDNQRYLDSALSPWLCEISSECWLKLLSETQRNDDSHYFEHNTAALLRMDTLRRYQAYAIGIRNGWLSPDEIRRAENMDPRADGGGDEYVDVAAANGATAGGAPRGAVDNGQNQHTGDGTADGDGEGEESGKREAASGGERRESDLGATPPAPPCKGGENHARSRVVYNLGGRARHKAKNPRAFVQWVDGGLAAHRAEAVELLGEPGGAVVDAALAELRGLVERVSAADLVAAVDAAATRWELGESDPPCPPL